MRRKKDKNDDRWLAAIVTVLILAGAFLIGIGCYQFIDNRKLRKEYSESELLWKQELADGTDTDIVRDLRNQELIENMKYISMEYQIEIESAEEMGIASVSNDEMSRFGCIVTLLRDATGEELYQSGLIEPGYYIETIHLKGSLKKGYYPCTAVWSFYTDNGEYVGETAWKIVLIVKK